MHRRWLRSKRASIEGFTFKVDLPSQAPEEPISACFDLRWQRAPGSERHRNPEAVIRDHILVCAEKISRSEPVTRYYVIRDRINAALGMPKAIDYAAIRLLWASVRITVNADLLTRVVEREQSRNKAREREQQQLDEIHYVEAFRSQVLADPGMALAYWFMKHPDGIDGNSYDAIEALARRIASYDPDNSWVQVSRIIQDFVRKLTESERRQSVEILKFWFRRFGMPEYGARLPYDVDEGESVEPSQ
jgi:hypothetical protein